jgi:hypothetical protein
MPMTEWTATDIEALTRAFRLACEEGPEERTRFEEMLATRGQGEAYETAAYHCQCRNLALKCWQAPPMHSGDIAYGTTATYGNKTSEVRLKCRMVALGLSIFEPDPAAAIAKAESARRAARRAERSAPAKPIHVV